MTVKDVGISGWLKDVNDNFQMLDVTAGTDYYVDGNAGDDDNDGLSWSKAFATLTVALAASHADIAATSFGWTARNRIFLKDDENEEDLVKLADKTDVIGVGSYDRSSKPRIIGNHVIVGAFMGTRFINCYFKSPAAGGDIMTVPTTVSGLEFIGCTFDGASATAATGAIITTAVESLKIEDCVFMGDYSDAVIEIGAGAGNQMVIKNNVIQGANAGIEVNSSYTTAARDSWIIGNYVATTGISIDENSDKIYIVGNRCFSGAAKGTTGFGIIDGSLVLMQDNRITGSDINNAITPAEGSL